MQNTLTSCDYIIPAMIRRTKLLFALTLLLLPTLLLAEEISLEKARRTAEVFLDKRDGGTRANRRLTCINLDQATRSGEPQDYYIFNREGGGFVIVSALDAARPVLGYSLEHSFSLDEDMPECLSDMLELYSYQIRARRSSGEPATAEERTRWDQELSMTRGERPVAVNLNTALWGQGAPFNRFCPLDTNGKRTITGCTATAISEVMYFHKHPKAGTGTLPGYTKTNGITIEDRPLGYEYEWDKMLPKYKNVAYTDEEANAVARLMSDVGVMCQAKYGTSATSAGSKTGVPRLATYFGYDKSILFFVHNYLTDEQWKEALMEELGIGRPLVCYANIPSGGAGHNFVIDGYDEADRFHVNWGWNGGSNGYFSIGAFYGGYNVGQIGYTRIRPDEGGDYEPCAYLRKTTQSGVVYKGMVYTSGSVLPGNSFKIRFGAVYNETAVTVTLQITFALFDKAGNLKCYLRDSPMSSSFSTGNYKWWSSATATIPSGTVIERGDYMEPLWRVSGETEWRHFANAGNPFDAIEGQLPLDIRDYAELSFDKASKKFTLGSFIGTRWTVYSPTNSVVGSGTTTAVETELPLTDVASGTYRVRLVYGGADFFINITL